MSILIGQYIRHALTSSETLTEKIGTNLYPIIVPMDGEDNMPYIVFASNGMDEASTKDGIYCDTTTEEILIFGRTLDETEEIAQEVRTAMAEGMTSWNEKEDAPFEVMDQTLRVGSEDYDLNHDGYFVTMTYQIETEYK